MGKHHEIGRLIRAGNRTQARFLLALVLEEHGGISQASRALGVHRTTIHGWMTRLREEEEEVAGTWLEQPCESQE